MFLNGKFLSYASPVAQHKIYLIINIIIFNSTTR
jgi:hypothetical protein